MEKDSKPHGGKRQGAGRKAGVRIKPDRKPRLILMTDTVYERLKTLKKSGQSIPDIIENLVLNTKTPTA